MKIEKVCVVGLGRLGGCLAVAMALQGIRVVGADKDPVVITALAGALEGGDWHRSEPTREQMGDAQPCLTLTTDLGAAVHSTDMAVVLVPTPTDAMGGFSLDCVLDAVRGIGEALRDRADRPYTVAVGSTVMPGSMRTPVRQALEEVMGRGLDSHVCPVTLAYVPEFVALGDCVRGFQEPEFVVIGCDGKPDDIVDLYQRFLWDPDIPILPMTLEEAEITKLALNWCVALKTIEANLIGALCERFPGANGRVVTRAVGLDPRIGDRYFKPGLPAGGPCLPPWVLVQTDHGLKAISDIDIGTNVLAHDGSFHRVTQCHIRDYTGDLVAITPEGFPQADILLTPEHPVWIRRRQYGDGSRTRIISTTGEKRLTSARGYGTPEFLPADQVGIGDLVLLPQLRPVTTVHNPSVTLEYRGNRVHLKSLILTPAMTRLFGWYLAEGSTWRKEINFDLHVSEVSYYEDIKALLRQEFGLKTRKAVKGKNGIRARATSRPLAEYLRQTFGNHSYNKHVPWTWLRLSEEHLIELLRGIWYGDGSRSGGRLTWATTSLELFNFVELVLLRLGVVYCTKWYKERIGTDGVRHRPSYFIWVQNPDSITKLSSYIPNLSLVCERKNKKSTWLEDGKFHYHVKQISTVPYQGQVYNLEVEDANSYVLHGCVVHNCFARDLKAMRVLATLAKTGNFLPAAAEMFNDWHASRLETLVERKLKRFGPDGKLGILGLAFKDGTDCTTGSMGWKLLEKFGKQAVAYDPLVIVGQSCTDAQTVAGRADVVFVSWRVPGLETVRWRKFQVIIDPWGMMDKVAVAEAEAILVLPGVGQEA